MTTRRDFLRHTGTATALLGTTPFAPAALAEPAPPRSDEWDLRWPDRITGKHRALFDVTEVEGGFGVWRASAWTSQYQAVLGIAPAELSPVVVIRHNAIILAMTNAFWTRYGLAAHHKVTHPLTGEPVDRNPATLDETNGIPAPYDRHAIQKQLARGVTMLACNIALQDVAAFVKGRDRVTDEAAYRIAREGLLPGIILQPSGVFAVVRAQEAGCVYVKGS